MTTTWSWALAVSSEQLPPRLAPRNSPGGKKNTGNVPRGEVAGCTQSKEKMCAKKKLCSLARIINAGWRVRMLLPRQQPRLTNCHSKPGAARAVSRQFTQIYARTVPLEGATIVATARRMRSRTETVRNGPDAPAGARLPGDNTGNNCRTCCAQTKACHFCAHVARAALPGQPRQPGPGTIYRLCV